MERIYGPLSILKRTNSIQGIVIVVAFLNGCASQVSKDKSSGGRSAGSPEITAVAPAVPVKPPIDPTIIAAHRGLSLGIAAYNRGDFRGAIKRFASADIAAGDLSTRVSALKYSAFSYCVTNRQTLCRQQFIKAMVLDPSFDLEAGEKGHPMWGPAFIRAGKATKANPLK